MQQICDSQRKARGENRALNQEMTDPYISALGIIWGSRMVYVGLSPAAQCEGHVNQWNCVAY